MARSRAKTAAAKANVSFVDVPKLRVHRGGVKPKIPAFNLSKQYSFRYDAKEQIDQPHVVKFSGGRSSGMLLLTLLEGGILKPERGDVVVFNNTSAEHPATYQYVARWKEIAEQQYGIPFFWTEFQTYEDAMDGSWRRFPAYRLTMSQEMSNKCPNGYHSEGEVFEELLSWKRFLPTRFQRICTQEMKLFATQEFLKDWFACKSGIERLGHWYGESLMDDETIFRLHQKYRGTTPREILLEKAEFVRNRPYIRPEQQYADYSSCVVDRVSDHLRERSLGGKAPLVGDDCVDYVTFVGFRADEPARVARMMARNYRDNECDEGNDPHLSVPEGEYVYAPLAEMGVSKRDVADFWRKQPKKLQLQLPDDASMSNCVFCFLKGSKNLVHILNSREKVEKNLPEALQSKQGTPSDIQWWVDMERKYGRDIKREKRDILNVDTAGESPIIGFWGLNGKMSYDRLAQAQSIPTALSKISEEEVALPCDCTD